MDGEQIKWSLELQAVLVLPLVKLYHRLMVLLFLPRSPHPHRLSKTNLPTITEVYYMQHINIKGLHESNTQRGQPLCDQCGKVPLKIQLL
jgi:hypothetical protein